MIFIPEEVAPKRNNLFSQKWTLISWKEEILEIGSELEVSVDAGLERLKVIFMYPGRRA